MELFDDNGHVTVKLAFDNSNDNSNDNSIGVLYVLLSWRGRTDFIYNFKRICQRLLCNLKSCQGVVVYS